MLVELFQKLLSYGGEVHIHWDPCSCQHFGLHGVQTLTLADSQLDFHLVMGILLVEEAIVDHKFCI